MSIHEIAKAIDRFAPLRKAKTSWDNVGILINTGSVDRRLLLTIDLTEPVLNECLEKKIGNIVAYHPVIFHPLKKLGTREKIVVQCIRNDINVFSPHTALDPLMNEHVFSILNQGPFSRKQGFGANMRSIGEAAERLKERGGLERLRVCLARSHSLDHVPKHMYVGVGAAFRKPSFRDALVVTGEMSHHDLLHCAANGVSVVLMEHSNSERICLEFIASKIRSELPEYDVAISSADRDPIAII
jgi:putative NIF3 family GTP cyclohydrolase 1 type 2